MSQPYNVFLSWAGEHAKQIAFLLRDWLPDVCKDAKPWMSETDIDKGADWSKAIDQTLATCKVCIVILTPESVKSQWVHFEAGALYKGLGENAICTLLCGAPTPIQFPLAKFQRTDFNKEQMEALTRTINTRLGDDVEQARHRRMIDAFWKNIEEPIQKIIADSQKGMPSPAKSPDSLMLEEVLNTVRRLEKKSSSPSPGLLGVATEKTEPAAIETVANDGRIVRVFVSEELINKLYSRPISLQAIARRAARLVAKFDVVPSTVTLHFGREGGVVCSTVSSHDRVDFAITGMVE